MKTIFTSKEINVLSLEGLEYTTNFSSVIAGSTHLPVFSRSQEKYFVHMGEELRWFIVNKTVYGFRYYDENGELSPYWTAIFCQLEGEDSECVILGRYFKNADAELLESSWELPYGYFRPETSYPRVFYKDKESFVRMECYRPDLTHMHGSFVAYRYDEEKHAAVSEKIEIDLYYIDRFGKTHIERKVDGKTWFDTERECVINHRKQMVGEN